MKTVTVKPITTPDDIVMKIQRNPTAAEIDQIDRARKDGNIEGLPELFVPLTTLTAARWACSTAKIESVDKASEFLDLYTKLKSVPDDADRVSFEDSEYRLIKGELTARAASTWGFLSPLIVRAFDDLIDPVAGGKEE